MISCVYPSLSYFIACWCHGFMGNHKEDIVYGNLYYTFISFIYMKTRCKFLVEEIKIYHIASHISHWFRKSYWERRPEATNNSCHRWNNTQGRHLRRKPSNSSFIEWGCALTTTEIQLFLFKRWSWWEI